MIQNPDEFWCQFQKQNPAWLQYVAQAGISGDRTRWQRIRKALMEHGPGEWNVLLEAQRLGRWPLLTLDQCPTVEGWLRVWLERIARDRGREEHRNEIRELCRRPDDAGEGYQFDGCEFGSAVEAFQYLEATSGRSRAEGPAARRESQMSRSRS